MRTAILILLAALLLPAINLGAEEPVESAKDLAQEAELADSTEVVVNASPEACCTGYRGNANGDPSEIINISDYTFLVGYCFLDGPPPDCREEGNADGDGLEEINILDIIYLYRHIFVGGPTPPPCP